MTDTSWTQLPRASDAEQRAPIRLPKPISDVLRNPEAYLPDSGLVAAANVSLLLGQPLLITGEPGSGKTAFAFWLAHQLGLGQPLVDVVKSTTTGRDLLYEFDSLARFRDSQRPADVSQTAGSDDRYVRFRPLGAAIAASADPAKLGGELARRVDDTLRAAGESIADKEDGRRRYVVLIDELDKALRDTPNDLLHEIEKMEFTVADIDRKITGVAILRPIVVITSNSERGLPEPFLRRCIYYNIPDLDAPDGRERLKRIVDLRKADIENSGDLVLAEAFERHAIHSVDKFYHLRERFDRKPGTAEFLALAIALARQEMVVGRANANAAKIWRDAVSSIAKIREDRKIALDAALAGP
jgi:MoxR-like ATPase